MIRAVAAIAIAGAALAVAGCGGGDDEGYPQEAVDNFMQSCTAQPNTTEEACGCVVDELEKTMPYEEFKRTDTAIRQQKGPSDESTRKLTAAVQTCLNIDS